MSSVAESCSCISFVTTWTLPRRRCQLWMPSMRWRWRCTNAPATPVDDRATSPCHISACSASSPRCAVPVQHSVCTPLFTCAGLLLGSHSYLRDTNRLVKVLSHAHCLPVPRCSPVSLQLCGCCCLLGALHGQNRCAVQPMGEPGPVPGCASRRATQQPWTACQVARRGHARRTEGPQARRTRAARCGSAGGHPW